MGKENNRMNKQNEALKLLLAELDEVDYVLSAWIVDGHGQIVVGRTEESLWSEAEVGMAVLAGTGSTEMFGQSLLLGDMVQSISEFRGGISLLAPLNETCALAVLAEPEVNLGMLRTQFRSVLQKLTEELSASQEEMAA